MQTFKKVAAVATSLAVFAPVVALADMNSSSMSIMSVNSGEVMSYTSSKATTGGNVAGGSRGGKGGSGGDVEVNGSGDANNGGAAAGNGGNGGNAGAGGWVETGDAMADAGSLTQVNTNDTEVDLGGGDMNSSNLGVAGVNEGGLMGMTKAKADTGDNNARGSRGGRGGSGGEVEANTGSNNNGGAEAGSGGSGGAGALGGTVATGASTSNAGSVSILNSNLVRVRI